MPKAVMEIFILPVVMLDTDGWCEGLRLLVCQCRARLTWLEQTRHAINIQQSHGSADQLYGVMTEGQFQTRWAGQKISLDWTAPKFFK